MRARRRAQARRLLRRTGARRRQHDHHRRRLAQPRRPARSGLRLHGCRPRRLPSRRDRRGPRRRRADPDADPARRPLRQDRDAGRRERPSVAYQPPQGARADRRRGRADHRGLRHRFRAGEGSRLRRRRGDGLRGLPHHPVHQRVDQHAHRPLGRLVRKPHALPGGDRAAHPRAPAEGLRHLLPPLGARSGRRRPHARRNHPAGARPGGGRRRRARHRHRLARGAHPHHRVRRAARGVGVLGQGDPRCRAGADHGHQPHQHAGSRGAAPRRRRRRPRVARPADARRREFRQQGQGRQSRRDQHVHRLQPGVPRLPLRRQAPRRASSIRAPDARRSSPPALRPNRSASPSSAPALPDSRAR